jgi:lipoprotein-releasing system ATP-binding protein
MLRVVGLRKEYSTPSGPLPVLQEVSLELGRGQALAVLGPSGSGKSTLLHILGTLDRPTAGSVLLDGQDPFVLDEAELAAFRNRKIGFVFQDHYLLPQCTVLENVLIPTLVGRQPGAEDRARSLLQRVGLSRRLQHLPAELSGGERQRIAVARALVNRPVLLLADEPTGNLDRRTARDVASLLLEMATLENAILIMVTHSWELALQFPQKREIVEGRLVPWEAPSVTWRQAACDEPS